MLNLSKPTQGKLEKKQGSYENRLTTSMTRNFQQENGQPLQRMYLSCPIFLEKKKAYK